MSHARQARQQQTSRRRGQTNGNSGGGPNPVIRGLIATVGVGLLFLLVAGRAFIGMPGAANAGDDETPSAIFPPLGGPTSTPVPSAPQGDFGPPRIALLAGHSGLNPAGLPDPGTLCEDGYSEVQVTTAVAERVAHDLRAAGYPVLVLEEYDLRTQGLRATLFVSIHVDSCEFINDEATGYKVSPPQSPRARPEAHARLAECITERYGTATGLSLHEQSITHDMTNYHNFERLDPNTPAVIIELGFLNRDRAILEKGQDKLVAGLESGIACFLQSP